jgi:hypothetical protein
MRRRDDPHFFGVRIAIESGVRNRENNSPRTRDSLSNDARSPSPGNRPARHSFTSDANDRASHSSPVS